MDTIPRYTDPTAEYASLEQRLAGITTALVWTRVPSTNAVGAAQTAAAVAIGSAQAGPKPFIGVGVCGAEFDPRKLAADIAAMEELLTHAVADV